MLTWKRRQRQISPVNQILSSVYFSLAKFQLVTCNLSFAMIRQNNEIYLQTAKTMSATLIWTPNYYGQFTLSLGKESPFISLKFNPLNTDSLLIRTLSMAPLVSVFIGFA